MTDAPSDGIHTEVRYEIEFDNQTEGVFMECTGLSDEHEVVEVKSNDKYGKPMTKKIPGNLKWTNIILRRIVNNDTGMWTWRKQVTDGNVDMARKNGAISMVDQDGNEIARWNFSNGWPCRIVSPLSDDSNAYALEEIEIVYESYERVK